MRIGIDFDNTLVDYDRVFAAAAARRGLVSSGFSGSKRELRDTVRRLPDGDCAWQSLQAEAYGTGIAEAVPFVGVETFLHECRVREIEVFVVSHKTRFASDEAAGVNLRAAAIGWMARHRFFADDGFGIPVERVYFESQRAAKLERIRALGCAHFIDDLEEVFAEPGFPDEVNPILFAETGALRRGAICATWPEIGAAVLDA